MIEIGLPDGHVWLRLTQSHDEDPFDPSFAQERGGRWNPPRSWPTLYLNEDLPTVHAQLRHLFAGRGLDPEDLDDDAPVLLAAATLPRRQTVADVVSEEGVEAVGLPPSYPLDAEGEPIGRSRTQAIGERVHDAGLRGVWCRSAAGQGQELAWFPARGAAARPVWSPPRPLGEWRNARTLEGLA